MLAGSRTAAAADAKGPDVPEGVAAPGTAVPEDADGLTRHRGLVRRLEASPGTDLAPVHVHTG